MAHLGSGLWDICTRTWDTVRAVISVLSWFFSFHIGFLTFWRAVGDFPLVGSVVALSSSFIISLYQPWEESASLCYRPSQGRSLAPFVSCVHLCDQVVDRCGWQPVKVMRLGLGRGGLRGEEASRCFRNKLCRKKWHMSTTNVYVYAEDRHKSQLVSLNMLTTLAKVY